MKKFLVVCLSVVMLFSTLLLCGFASPKTNDESLPSINGYIGTPFVITDNYDSLYFNSSLSIDSISRYLDTQFNEVFEPLVIPLMIIGSNILSFAIIPTSFSEYESEFNNYYMLGLVPNDSDEQEILFNTLNEPGSIVGWNNNLSSPLDGDIVFTDSFNNQLSIILSPILSSTEFFIPPTFFGTLIDGIGQVFIEYVPMLAIGILNMFTCIFWQNGAFTILGYALVTLVGIALVSSIFYTVFRIFKGKIKKRL